MKRIIVLGALLLPVATVYGASSRFFASGVQRSNYWRSEAVFTSGEEITFISGEDEHTAPVEIDDEESGEAGEIEELLIDEQEEQAEPVEIDEEAEQSDEVIEDELTTGEPAEEVSQ